MTRQNIIDRVKVEMDELTPFDEELIVSGNNTLTKPIDAYIEEILDECAEDVIAAAPNHLITLKSFVGNPTITNGVATMNVPTDFIGLGYISFSDWERPVTQFIKETDPLYLRQKNKYTRAGVSRPVAAIRSGVIECYSVSSASPTLDFKYKAKVVAEVLPTKLITPLVYLTAAKMFKIFERNELVSPTMELFNNALTTR